MIVRAEREKFRTFSRFLKNPLSTYVRKVQIAKRIKYLGQRTEEVPPPKRKSTVMERYRKQIRASSTPQEKDAALGTYPEVSEARLNICTI